MTIPIWGICPVARDTSEGVEGRRCQGIETLPTAQPERHTTIRRRRFCKGLSEGEEACLPELCPCYFASSSLSPSSPRALVLPRPVRSHRPPRRLSPPRPARLLSPSRPAREPRA